MTGEIIFGYKTQIIMKIFSVRKLQKNIRIYEEITKNIHKKSLRKQQQNKT